MTTPGPWKYIPWKGHIQDDPSRVIGSNGSDVADIYNEDDAALIAAAPELLAAAQAISKKLGARSRDFPAFEELRSLRGAIAKATDTH